MPGLAVQIAMAAIMGGAIGLVYFVALRRSVDVLVGGGTTMPAFGLTAFRIALAATGFWLIANWGAGPLIATALGFTVARYLVGRPTAGDG